MNSLLLGSLFVRSDRRLFSNVSCAERFPFCHDPLQESRRVIQELEDKTKQLSKDLKEANDEKSVSTRQHNKLIHQAVMTRAQAHGRNTSRILYFCSIPITIAFLAFNYGRHFAFNKGYFRQFVSLIFRTIFCILHFNAQSMKTKFQQES